MTSATKTARFRQRIEELITIPISAWPLAIFRIFLGASVIVEGHGNVSRAAQYTPGQFHLPYVDFVSGLEFAQYVDMCHLQVAFGALLVIGIFSRFAAAGAIACQGYLFLISQLNFRNHVFFMLAMLLFMMMTRSDKVMSWQHTLNAALRRRQPALIAASLAAGLLAYKLTIGSDKGVFTGLEPPQWLPIGLVVLTALTIVGWYAKPDLARKLDDAPVDTPWFRQTIHPFGVRLMQMQIISLYFFASLHKVFKGFLDGYPLCEFLSRESRYSRLESVLSRTNCPSSTACVEGHCAPACGELVDGGFVPDPAACEAGTACIQQRGYRDGYHDAFFCRPRCSSDASCEDWESCTSQGICEISDAIDFDTLAASAECATNLDAFNMSINACSEDIPKLIVIMSIASVLTEFFLAFGLLHRRTVLLAAVAGIGLHFGIFMSMNVVTFGLIAVGTYALFWSAPPLQFVSASPDGPPKGGPGPAGGGGSAGASIAERPAVTTAADETSSAIEATPEDAEPAPSNARRSKKRRGKKKKRGARPDESADEADEPDA